MESAGNASCGHNLTGGPVGPEFFDLADTYKVVMGSLIFVVMIPLMRLNLSVFPVGSLFAVLLAALLMVVFQVVGQEEVYDVIAGRGSLTAVFLLLGVLVMAQYVDREQIAVRVLRKLLLPSLRFEVYLIRTCFVVFFFAALFSNDACCAVLTPILLQVWEAQERPRTELESLLLAVMTSANIGAMVTVFSSLPMALMAAKTDAGQLAGSRLDMRACLMYLLPVALILWSMNTCFLILHYRIRTRHIEKSKLVSEPSQSEQEMAGLTARDSNGSVNGYLPNSGRAELVAYEGVYFGPAASQHSDERIAIPCQLQTIPEDDILEISSSQNASPRDRSSMESPSPQHGRYAGGGGGGIDAEDPSALDGCETSSSDSSGDERDRMRNTDENLHQLNISYRPGALQSQNLNTADDSCSSLAQSLEHHGLAISQRLGVYHSLTAFSVTHFLPLGTDEAGSPMPTDSLTFAVVLVVLMLVVVALLTASCYFVTFDLGLVPLAASVVAVTTDAVISRRPALALVRRADWSVVLLVFGLFVWMQGFHNTHVLRFVWHRTGLQAASYGAMGARTLAVFCVFILLGSNVFGSIPIVLMVCDLLEPCMYQRGIVLYLAILCTAGSNLTLYASTANLITVQRGVQVLKYRLPSLVHLQYGLLSSLVLLPFGIILIYGLLLIGVK